MNHLNSVILEGVIKQIDGLFLIVSSTKGSTDTLVKCMLSEDLGLKKGSLVRLVGGLMNYGSELILKVEFVEVRETKSTIKSGKYIFKMN